MNKNQRYFLQKNNGKKGHALPDIRKSINSCNKTYMETVKKKIHGAK